MMFIEKIENLKELIYSLKTNHYTCDDAWYSCPLSSDGCLNPDEKECNCGADEHNKKVDDALNLLEDI